MGATGWMAQVVKGLVHYYKRQFTTHMGWNIRSGGLFKGGRVLWRVDIFVVRRDTSRAIWQKGKVWQWRMQVNIVGRWYKGRSPISGDLPYREWRVNQGNRMIGKHSAHSFTPRRGWLTIKKNTPAKKRSKGEKKRNITRGIYYRHHFLLGPSFRARVGAGVVIWIRHI